MRNRNFVDVAVVTAVMIITAAGCCSGKPTGSQLRVIIQKIMSNDTFWKDMLSERVRFDLADPRIQALDVNYMTDMFNLEDIDPLDALQKLMRPVNYFWGSELTMSAYILDATLSCFLFKRVTVEIALTIRMLALESEERVNIAQATVFAHVLPYFIDILSLIELSYVELLKLYDVIVLVLSQKPDKLDWEKYGENLKSQLENLNTIIGKTCKCSDMKLYFRQLMLPTVQKKNLVDVITDNSISAHVELNSIVALLEENENAILDLSEQMHFLGHIDMDVWKKMLKYPDLPTTFKRNSTPSYSELMSTVLHRNDHTFMAVPVHPMRSTSQPIQYWPAASSSLV